MASSQESDTVPLLRSGRSQNRFQGRVKRHTGGVAVDRASPRGRGVGFPPFTTSGRICFRSKVVVSQSGLGRATKSAGRRFGWVRRFSFHLINDMDVPDEEGKELSDPDAARAEAGRQAHMLMGEMLKTEAHINLGHRIDIEDEQRTVVATVRFKDVVKIDRQDPPRGFVAPPA